jgi:hypothetical protein
MLSDKVLNEICEILKNEGRYDLVAILVDDNDSDYIPPKYVNKDFYSDDEGSATDESFDVEEDDEGFLSLKSV